jgi:acyl carrier protein
MAKLLTTKGIAFFLDELFKSSNEFVNIVTPYFKLGRQLEERINEASQTDLKITFIFGKDKSQSNFFSNNLLKNLDIFFYENLHAKFYMNERFALITSMNMHSYSQANNREIGVLFSKKDLNDLGVYQDCIKEFDSILKSSQVLNLRSKSNQIFHTQNNLTAKNINSSAGSSVPERIKSIIVDKLGAEIKVINNNAKLIDDLGADSLDLVELVMEIENEFEISISDEHIEKVKTVGETIKYVEDKLSKCSTGTSIPIEKYSFEEFRTEWIDFLVRNHKETNFKIENETVLAKDFPVKNIDFSLQYGFATFRLNSNKEFLKKLKITLKTSLENDLHDYRFYWNQFDQICIYHGKDVSFKNLNDDIKYCNNAIKLISNKMTLV